eukprot:155332_1
MEGGQLVKPSTQSIDCFLDIVAKKRFVIDTTLEMMTRSKEHHVELHVLSLLCCKDSNKNTSFNYEIYRMIRVLVIETGNEDVLYQRKKKRFNMWHYTIIITIRTPNDG